MQERATQSVYLVCPRSVLRHMGAQPVFVFRPRGASVVGVQGPAYIRHREDAEQGEVIHARSGSRVGLADQFGHSGDGGGRLAHSIVSMTESSPSSRATATTAPSAVPQS